MAAKEDCLLVVVGPRDLEAEMIDALTEAVPSTGYTVSHVEGYGRASGHRSAAEEVHGRGHRTRVDAVLTRADVATAIQHLTAVLHNRSVAYWVLPVLEFGRCS